MARSDIIDAKIKTRRYGSSYSAYLTKSIEYADEHQERFDAHCDEAHGGVPDLILRTSRLSKRVPKPIPDGKAKCALCHKVVTLMNEGRRLRTHKTPDGEACPGVAAPGAKPMLTIAPPVQVQTRAHDTAKKGECRECHRWLPGERSICGRCSVLQGRSA